MKRVTTRVVHVQVFFSPLVSPCLDLQVGVDMTLRLAGKETSAERPMDFLPSRAQNLSFSVARMHVTPIRDKATLDIAT